VIKNKANLEDINSKFASFCLSNDKVSSIYNYIYHMYSYYGILIRCSTKIVLNFRCLTEEIYHEGKLLFEDEQDKLLEIIVSKGLLFN